MSDCLYCKICAGEIPAHIVHQDERAVAFRDIHPQAPTHILVVPRKHLATLDHMGEADEALIGHLHTVAQTLAKSEGISGGYRSVFNTGASAGQSVFHVHLHLLGGRPLLWPPG
jgi:histidine triad (HIT) family protein